MPRSAAPAERRLMNVPSVVSIVDDDRSVRESLLDLVCALGFDARVFASANEFLESSAISTTDCLVLDVAMPGMSGFQLQRELQRRGSRTPIVFITASRDDQTRQRLMTLGAVDCLFKPFDERSLLDSLNRATAHG